MFGKLPLRFAVGYAHFKCMIAKKIYIIGFENSLKYDQYLYQHEKQNHTN